MGQLWDQKLALWAKDTISARQNVKKIKEIFEPGNIKTLKSEVAGNRKGIV